MVFAMQEAAEAALQKIPAGMSRAEYQVSLEKEFHRHLNDYTEVSPWSQPLSKIADKRSARLTVRKALRALNSDFDVGDSSAQRAAAKYATACVSNLVSMMHVEDDGDMLSEFLHHLLLLVSYKKHDFATFLKIMNGEERASFRCEVRKAFLGFGRSSKSTAKTLAKLSTLQVTDRERLATRLCDRIDVIEGVPLQRESCSATSSCRSQNI